MSDERPIFIIDGQNMYLRSYAAYPAMSSQGHQVGGCVGFLRTLQRLCREYQPVGVYVIWEGGGSSRRRKLFPEYKMKRRPEKLNRFYGDDIPDSEENKQHQLVTLIGMLKHVPVCQIYVPDCEGDDVIAYLCRGPMRSLRKVIVSADKDMYQLLDDDTSIYSLHRKTFVTSTDVLSEFGIRTHNFALAKCVAGDPGDNVPGVDGIGFKTVAKKFPLLASDEVVLLSDFVAYAAARREEGAVYRKVFEAKTDLERNWQLVHLDGSVLSADQSRRVDYVVDTFKPSVDRMGLVKALMKEGVVDFDAEGFYYDISCVQVNRDAPEKR